MPMDASHSRVPWLTRRAFLGTAAGAAAAVYGIPLILPERPTVPAAYAAADFKLRAPEPKPKYGGGLRDCITTTPPHFDIPQSGTLDHKATPGRIDANLIRPQPLGRGPAL